MSNNPETNPQPDQSNNMAPTDAKSTFINDEMALQSGKAVGADQTPTFETPDRLASTFHEAYERLAPNYSYETRKASAKPWKDVPANNQELMRAVAAEIIQAHQAALQKAEQAARIDGMRTAMARVLARTAIPKGARNPTRDAIVLLGEDIANIIDQDITQLTDTK